MDLYPNGTELVWRRIFPGRPEQARKAREFVAFLLADLPALDDAVVVTGELTANVLQHTTSSRPGGQFLLEVRRHPDGAAVAVTDQGSLKKPTIPCFHDLSESGRGLYTAQALTEDLSWCEGAGGRTFTALFKASPYA